MFDEDGDGSISPEELKSVFAGAAGSSKNEEVWLRII